MPGPAEAIFVIFVVIMSLLAPRLVQIGDWLGTQLRKPFSRSQERQQPPATDESKE